MQSTNETLSGQWLSALKERTRALYESAWTKHVAPGLGAVIQRSVDPIESIVVFIRPDEVGTTLLFGWDMCAHVPPAQHRAACVQALVGVSRMAHWEGGLRCRVFQGEALIWDASEAGPYTRTRVDVAGAVLGPPPESPADEPLRWYVFLDAQ